MKRVQLYKTLSKISLPSFQSNLRKTLSLSLSLETKIFQIQNLSMEKRLVRNRDENSAGSSNGYFATAQNSAEQTNGTTIPQINWNSSSVPDCCRSFNYRVCRCRRVRTRTKTRGRVKYLGFENGHKFGAMYRSHKLKMRAEMLFHATGRSAFHPRNAALPV